MHSLCSNKHNSVIAIDSDIVENHLANATLAYVTFMENIAYGFYYIFCKDLQFQQMLHNL